MSKANFKKKVKKAGGHFFEVDPYKFPIIVWRGQENFVNGVMSLFGYDITESIDGAAGYCAEFQNENGLITIVMMLPEEYDEIVVWHEALHATWFVFAQAGVKSDEDNHEHQCYTQGTIVDDIRQVAYGMESFYADL